MAWQAVAKKQWQDVGIQVANKTPCMSIFFINGF